MDLSTPEPNARTPIRPLLPLYLAVLAGFTGYGMMTVLFTHMVMDPGAGFLPPAESRARRTTLLGILLAIYPLGQFFGTPVLSSLSDRLGRRRVLQIVLSAMAVSYLLAGIALQMRSIPLLAASLLLCGVGDATVAVAQSAIADASREEDRGRLFGYVYVALRLGYVIGPLAGGQVAAWTHDYAAPFWLVAVLLGATLALLTAGLVERSQGGTGGGAVEAFAGLVTIFTDRALRPVYLLNFLLYLCVFGFSRTVVMFMVDVWHMSIREVTLFYSYFAAMVLVANFGLMPLLSPRLGLVRLAAGAALVGGSATILVALTRDPIVLWSAVGVASSCLSLCLSGSAALLSAAATREAEGRVMGNNEALQVAAQSIGTAGGGLLASVAARLPILLFGGLVIAMAPLLARKRSRPGPQADAGRGSSHRRE